MRRILLGLLLSLAVSLGFVQVVKVEPVKASWSGWVRRLPPNNYVAQGITCNFDVPIFADYFTGTATSQSYRVELRFPGENGFVVAHGDTQIQGDHKWIRCYFKDIVADSVIKGRQYEVRWTLSGGPDSLMYYYDSTDNYEWGQIVLPGQQVPVHDPRDLCLRVYGVMDTVRRTFFGMDESNFVPWTVSDSANRNRLRRGNGQLADSAYIGSMMVSYLRWQDICSRDSVPPESIPAVNWCDFNARLWAITQDAHARAIVSICGVAKYASSRETLVWKYFWVPDTAMDGYWDSCLVWDTAVYCAPRNLWDSDSNYWAQFISSMINHPEADPNRVWPGGGKPFDSVHVFEFWNEPNDTCIDSRLYHRGVSGWWRRPNRDYLTGFDGLEGLVRLYVRMAYAACSTIRSNPGHANDTVLIGATHRIFLEGENCVKGLDFIRKCYEMALQEPGYIFWDGVSFHPYQNGYAFIPDTFEVMAESVRAVARAHGDEDCLVWCSEVGIVAYDWWHPETFWPYCQQDFQRYIPQVYTTALASQVLPGARYDQCCQWWWFSTLWDQDWYGLIGLRGITDTIWNGAYWLKFTSYFTFKQMTEQLVGWQFESRVPAGDSVRLYEFRNPQDDKRKWVGWVIEPTGRATAEKDVKVPVRTDWVLLEGSGADQPPGGQIVPVEDADGWLRLELMPQALYMTEASDTSRPDLRVDSVWLVPNPQGPELLFDLFAQVTNHGNDSTGTGTPVTTNPNTVVRFYSDNSCLGQIDYSPNIRAGESVTIGPLQWRVPSPGACLVRATVNEKQWFVELGMDDNAAFRRCAIPQ